MLKRKHFIFQKVKGKIDWKGWYLKKKKVEYREWGFLHKIICKKKKNVLKKNDK